MAAYREPGINPGKCNGRINGNLMVYRIGNLTLLIDSIEKRRIRSFARQQVGPPD
ncbi:MAG: hypothetical protein QOI05_4191 [Bradyrhizobium sp.]|jgi:hypothetical protein|nr:hypothetical protein [Bradyrhizobium sp.]